MKNLIESIREDVIFLKETLEEKEQTFITDEDIVAWCEGEIGDEDVDIIYDAPTVKCNGRHGDSLEFKVANLKDGKIEAYGISDTGYQDKETFDLDELSTDELLDLGAAIRE